MAAADIYDDIADVMQVRDAAWRERAMCRDLDPSFFFPPTGGRGSSTKQILALHFETARSACAACPVISECLTETLARDEDGFRAGEWSGDRRRRLDAEMYARQGASA